MGGSASRSCETSPQELADHEFDYIIVGSGPAGCVLANRLSEDPSNTVLLVEAGKNNETEIFSKIPGAWPRLLHTHADWDYRTTPQPTLGGRSLYWPRGRILGGSSSINSMMYQHAPPDDLDEWERLGARGWNAKSMAPYFRKAERFTPSFHHKTTYEHRGDSGPWLTGYCESHPVSDRFVEACVNAGIHAIPEHNTPKGPNGVSHMVSFIDSKSRRSSAATAYLPQSVRQRPNLTILTETRCTRVMLSPTAGSAGGLICTGAEFSKTKEGPRTVINARKEVILCSGAIGTPQILMCSGIGPKEVLGKAGITVTLVQDHVGKNMLDHLTCWSIFRAKESWDYTTTPLYRIIALFQYFLFGAGSLATNKGDAAAFIRLEDQRHLWNTKPNTLPTLVPDTTSGPSGPDAEIISCAITFYKHAAKRPPPGTKAFSAGSTLLRPLSAGHIALTSGSVFDDPIIEANYFQNKVDLEQLMRVVRTTVAIAHTSPLRDKLVLDYNTNNEDMNGMHWLADQDPETLTDEKLEAWVRLHAETLYHPVCTARMAKSPAEGVVDAELRVFGVKDLRVADASVFPNQIAAHTTATVVALGERAADLILGGVI